MLKSPISSIEVLVQADLTEIPDVTTCKFDLGEEFFDVRCTLRIEEEVIRAEPGEQPGTNFVRGGGEWWERCEELIVCGWLLSRLGRRRVIHRRGEVWGQRGASC